MRNVTLRLSDGDYQILSEQAERYHTTPTSYLRELILRAKQRDDIPMLATAIAQALRPHLAASEERINSTLQAIPDRTAQALQQLAAQQRNAQRSYPG